MMNLNVPGLFRKLLIPVASGTVAVIGYRILFVSKHIPWMWIGIVLILAASTGAGIYLYQRQKKKKAAAGGNTAIDESARAAAEFRAAKESALKSLQQKWKDAIDRLKGSRLKRTGDPVYALPWYMVMGPENGGKTSAIQNAQMLSFADSSVATELVPTKNCQWMFFDQAVVIDTAGRFSSALDKGTDKEEWKKFRDLLYKHRKKESLNGLVVVVPADRLLNLSPEQLELEGKTIRARIDELMDTLGAKFPIYIQVTKSDLVPGMPKFFAHLSQNGLMQTMGSLNQDLSSDINGFLNKTFNNITERLKTFRLVMADKTGAGAMDPDLFLLPDMVAKLKTGVTAFAKGAFQENPFQETPLLRGLHFSSAKMEGIAPFADKSKDAWKKLGAKGQGIFLHDFFANVLPADRALFMPTRKAIHWRREVLSLKVIAWLGGVVFLGGMMTYSFIKNLNTLRDADREFSHLPSLQNDIASDIETLTRRFERIEALTEKNHSAWHSVFMLNHAKKVNRAIEVKLATQFRETVLTPVDDQYAKALAALNRRSPNGEFATYVGYLVERIKLVKNRLYGAPEETPEEETPEIQVAAFVPFLNVSRGQASPELKDKFGNLFVRALDWYPNRDVLERELVWLQLRLKHTLSLKGNSPDWVIAWAKSQHSVPPISLADYWGGEGGTGNEPTVSPVFSRKNKDVVDSFFGEVEAALGDPAVVAELKKEFYEWHREHALKAWYNFALDFNKGENRLQSKEEWKQVIVRMAEEENPYFMLLNDMANELEPIAQTMGEKMPKWLVHVYQFQDLQNNDAGSNFVGLLFRGKKEDAEGIPRDVIKAYSGYRKSLRKLLAKAAREESAVEMAKEAFSPEEEAKNSVFTKTFESLNELKEAVKGENMEDRVIPNLVRGPLDFAWTYTLRDAANFLQSEWEVKVLSETSGFTGPQALSTLLSQDGPVMNFVKTPAAQFVKWKQGKGYYPNEAFGDTLPFNKNFFSFLNRGSNVSMLAQIDNLSVNIASLPPALNKSAKKIPQVIGLQLDCQGEKQIMINRRGLLFDKNFGTVDKSFRWTPSCTNTTLVIDVGRAHLVKNYPGPYGFFTFLGEFRDGKHVFFRDDFPSEKDELRKLDIRHIIVRFKVRGAPNLDAPRSVPSKIAFGWGS